MVSCRSCGRLAVSCNGGLVVVGCIVVSLSWLAWWCCVAVVVCCGVIV